MAQAEEMYQCQTVNCGYIYNPDKGDRKGKIPAGTKFEDIPDDWKCPICGGTKRCFRPLAGPGSTVEVSCPAPDAGAKTMQKYVCNICGYVYDPAEGDPDNDVKPGTKWEAVPAAWSCPICGASKENFSPE
jgi:rubredoxin